MFVKLNVSTLGRNRDEIIEVDGNDPEIKALLDNGSAERVTKAEAQAAVVDSDVAPA